MKDWRWRLAENAPSVVFLIGLRLDWRLDLTAAAAAVLATLVFVALLRAGRRPDTILLGINLNFVLATAVIWSAYTAGFDILAKEMIRLSGVAVITTIFVTGLALTRLTERGFAGIAGKKRSSLALLAVAGLGCVWSIAFIGDQFLSVGLPIIVLFACRRILLRRTDAAFALAPFIASVHGQPAELI